jgi:hypothetical protein
MIQIIDRDRHIATAVQNLLTQSAICMDRRRHITSVTSSCVNIASRGS